MDLSIAPFVKIKNKPTILFNNKVYVICDQKCNFFYKVMVSKLCSRHNMESIYARQFDFPNSQHIWKHIYKQKLVDIKLPKIREFNYKVLNNIVPCGVVLNKWIEHISDRCELCNGVETTFHMLFGCTQISNIWMNISRALKCNISWKHIVCGWPHYDHCKKLECFNLVLSIVASAIYKQNSRCKFNKHIYSRSSIVRNIKETLICYQLVMNHTKNNIMFNRYVDCIKNYPL